MVNLLKIEIQTQIVEDLERGINQQQVYNEILTLLNDMGCEMANTVIKIKREKVGGEMNGNRS